MDDVRDGLADASTFDDYVEQWHFAPDDSLIAEMSLHAYMGLTWEQYMDITKDPSSLEKFIEANRG